MFCRVTDPKETGEYDENRPIGCTEVYRFTSHSAAKHEQCSCKATEIRGRFGLEAAQVIVGHAAADVTQIYAERGAEKAREVARKIG